MTHRRDAYDTFRSVSGARSSPSPSYHRRLACVPISDKGDQKAEINRRGLRSDSISLDKIADPIGTSLLEGIRSLRCEKLKVATEINKLSFPWPVGRHTQAARDKTRLDLAVILRVHVSQEIAYIHIRAPCVRELPVKDAGNRPLVDKDIGGIKVSMHETRIVRIGLLLQNNAAQGHGRFRPDPCANVGAFEHGSEKTFPIAKIKWRNRSACLNPTT
jgi:hypothetical protein